VGFSSDGFVSVMSDVLAGQADKAILRPWPLQAGRGCGTSTFVTVGGAS
jgi:hypothetical protein